MKQSYLSKDNLNVDTKITLEQAHKDDNFMDAICDYIHDIVKVMPAPYTLFVSGGVDSQAMLYAWKKSGVPFRAIHVSYQGFNAHDYMEMAIFAERHSIKIEQMSFDILDFLENRLDDYALTYKCSSPQICTHMAFTEMIKEGTKILSGNVPIPNQPSMNNTIFGLQRYATLSKANMVPFFLLSDKRSASIAANLAGELDPSITDLYEFKCLLYRELGIPVIPQESKLTGFEKLKEHYDGFPERVTSDMKRRHSSFMWTQVFDHLFRNKYMLILNNNYKTKFVVQK